MTTAVFETATLADTIKKAARVAPAKGQAFDKAAGLVLDVAPDVTQVRATNLEIYYMEWVDSMKVEGDRAVWRVPAALFASVLGSLPIGTGKTVELRQDGNLLHMSSGRTKARFNLLDPEYYPIWTVFDPDNLVKANDLGGRIAQVSWAASGNAADVPWNGVHLDGQMAVATDRYRLATVPLAIPDLVHPVTVPGALLATVLKQTGEVDITVEGTQLLLMPDEHSQVRAVCYAQEYPPVQKIMRRDQPRQLQVHKSALVEMISRAQNFAGSDRTPILRLFIGQEEVAVMMSNHEVGMLGDVVDVTGYADHKRCEFKFTPKNLLDALNAAPNDEVVLAYDDEKKARTMRIDGGSGYEAWIAPRADTAGE